MIRHDDTDRVLEEWFADGPSRMPDHLVAATLDLIDTTPQPRLRLPWSSTMNRLVTYAAALAAVMVVGVAALAALGGIGGLGGQPTPSPTPTPTDTFTSTRHGYSVRLPQGRWTYEERAGSWAVGDYFDANTVSGVDYYERPPTATEPGLYVYLASQAVPDGMTFDGWVATHDIANAAEVPCFQPVAEPDGATVAGEPARVIVQRCEDFDGSGAWMAVQTLVVHGGEGYALYVWPQLRGELMPSIEDLQAESSAWLSTFAFSN